MDGDGTTTTCGEKRFHCEHCGEKISRSLYFEHKRLYYSSTSGTWKKELFTANAAAEQQFEDFVFPEHEEDTLQGMSKG